MKVPNRQIGWGQEAILLQGISKQLVFIAGLANKDNPAGKLSPLELNTINFTASNNGPGNIDSNTAMGVGFYSNITGYDNTSYGREVLSLNTDGYQNTAVGMYAFQITPSGKLNTVIGSYALPYNSSGDGNTAFGTSAAGSNVDLPFLGTGINNTAIGDASIGNLTSGIGNTVVGVVAMEGNPFPGGVPDNPVTGNYNIGLGFECDITLSTGNNNVMIEIGLGQEVEDGSRNIVINPKQTGLKSSNNNIILGGAPTNTPDVNSQVIIGTGSSVRRIWFDTSGAVTITTAPINGAGVATEKVVLLDVNPDTNNMNSIKTVDYIDTNATTTALTLANLNATYPGTSIGFRVQCMSIAGAPKIYTKVSTTNWCSEAVLSVA